MFIQTHIDSINGTEQVLTFLKSANVQAYPCGRRRSELVAGYRIPFDPEARLNTEANAVKHSGLNGFTQSYLIPSDYAKFITMALSGYLFTITIDDKYIYTNSDNEPALHFGNLCDSLFNSLSEKAEALLDAAIKQGKSETEIARARERVNSILNATHIYANVVLEEVPLYKDDSFKNYYTKILRNQSNTSAAVPRDSIDLLKDLGSATTGTEDFNNYYFSGLSFSTEAITGKPETQSKKDISSSRDVGGSYNQTLVSLCILERTQLANGDWGEWKIHQPAYLPKIKHGTTEDSIVISGDATVKTDLTVEKDVTVLELIESKNEIRTVNLTAADTITTKDLTVEGYATIAGLNVGDNIAAGSVAADEITLTGGLSAEGEVSAAAVSVGTLTATDATIINTAITNTTITNATITNLDVTSTANIGTLASGSHTIEGDDKVLTVKNTAGDSSSVITHDTIKSTIIEATTLSQNGKPVPTISLKKQTDDSWQLQFSNVTILE